MVMFVEIFPNNGKDKEFIKKTGVVKITMMTARVMLTRKILRYQALNPSVKFSLVDKKKNIIPINIPV